MDKIEVKNIFNYSHKKHNARETIILRKNAGGVGAYCSAPGCGSCFRFLNKEEKSCFIKEIEQLDMTASKKEGYRILSEDEAKDRLTAVASYTPTKSKATRHRISIVLKEETNEKLNKECERLRVQKEELIVKLIEEYLDE